MPRKRFLQDVDETKYCAPDGVQDFSLDDGETISFTYLNVTQGRSTRLPLKLIPTNIDEYPAGNGYILFTEDNNVDPKILGSLERLQFRIDRTEIHAALLAISSGLHEVITAGQAHNPIDLVDSDRPDPADATHGVETTHPEQVDLEEEGDHDDADEMDWDASDIDSDDGFGFGFTDIDHGQLKPLQHGQPKPSTISRDKIKADLLATKAAGFKVGIHGNLSSGGVVCISIRVTKLGISEEAMQAWTLKRSQYFVLLIRFKHGYRDLVQYKDDKPSDDRVEMYVTLCNTYKPRLADISQAFVQADTETENFSPPSSNDQSSGLEPLFIGKPINDLLRDRFRTILKFRLLGLGWTGAERLFNETQGSLIRDISATLLAQQQTKDSPQKRALPSIVMSDVLENTKIADAPLPLVAMQFVLRHFVRCTEFCLACHCHTEATFEALKPYVCSKPLCLYQFLSYGFGPSVEHEILSQPYMVDLLVSLCFSQTAAHRMKDVPIGLNLKVPFLPSYTDTMAVPVRSRSHTPIVGDITEALEAEATFYAAWNPKEDYLVLNDDAWKSKADLKEGDWLAIQAEEVRIYHFRVKFISLPHIYLFDRITSQASYDGPTTMFGKENIPVACYVYNHDFDSMSRKHQHQAILAMLTCLPSISSLRQQLLLQRAKQHENSLHRLRNIPPSARDLLRWIIASNRSCIVQVDMVAGVDAEPDNLLAAESRVGGMVEWVQFRFAQGAPDKEQRFVEAVKKNTTNAKYPTFFAWHGSPIYNWHSIIRNGLNFDEIQNGRANGNGVYMSNMLNTSIGYSHIASSAVGMNEATWPNSELSVSQVVSLQEVVNAPMKFVCSQPHFVVAQKDWIQTRYLFVKSAVRHSVKGNAVALLDQDPNYLVLGSDNKPLQIPITAISQSRRSEETKNQAHTREQKKLSATQPQEYLDDDDISEATADEDTRWFESDREFWDLGSHDAIASPTTDGEPTKAGGLMAVEGIFLSGARKRPRDIPKYILDQAVTDFRPGTLDVTNIKFLPPPSDASPAATRALLKAFQATLQTQETTPLHELGFYLDPDRVENMYQWIIELHSFDRTLPLAEDMKKAGVTSVVLEMRFTNQFPFSPPFVRVVKPRFLPFLQGGGGHVTEGGAICMELLTSTGWSVVSSVESVLLQIRLAMSERERPARLLTTGGRKGHGMPAYDISCYGIYDAVQAFKRACSKHGWRVPDGVDSFTS